MISNFKAHFKAYKDKSGKVILGLWVSEICRVERIEELWAAQAPLRRIGTSNYYEYHSDSTGGAWQSIGSYRTRKAAMHNAKLLVEGNHVWMPSTIINGEIEPGKLHEFKNVVNDIRISQNQREI